MKKQSAIDHTHLVTRCSFASGPVNTCYDEQCHIDAHVNLIHPFPVVPVFMENPSSTGLCQERWTGGMLMWCPLKTGYFVGSAFTFMTNASECRAESCLGLWEVCDLEDGVYLLCWVSRLLKCWISAVMDVFLYMRGLLCISCPEGLNWGPSVRPR